MQIIIVLVLISFLVYLLVLKKGILYPDSMLSQVLTTQFSRKTSKLNETDTAVISIFHTNSLNKEIGCGTDITNS